VRYAEGLVTHAQTWASYSTLYRFGRLSITYAVISSHYTIHIDKLFAATVPAIVEITASVKPIRLYAECAAALVPDAFVHLNCEVHPWGMTNYPIGPQRTQSDPTGPQYTSFYRCTLHLGLRRRDGLYRRDS